MRTIRIDFTDSTVGTLGRAGEHNNTEVVFSLTPELAKCDLITAEIGTANGEKIPVEGERDNEINTFTLLLTNQFTAEGVLTLQLIGCVMQEGSDEPQIIAKSPVVSGIITPSINGVEIEADSNPSLLHRIWAKLEAWAGKIHEHANKEQLDLITTEMLQSIGTDKPVVIKTGIRYVGAISSNVCTVFETKMDRLAITALLAAGAKNTIPEYVFIFTSGAGGFPTTLSMPRGIKWANDDIPEIKVDCKYIIRIFDNVASYTEVTI